MAPIRRGGRATTADGDLLTWTEAEGARGTRWREALEREGRLVRALLLEVSTAGRPTRLEMTTPAGLLTLHPEPDESALHGNVVGPGGVRHLAFDWSPDHELLVLGSPASMAVTVRRIAPELMVGASRIVELLLIDDGLVPRLVRESVERESPLTWRMADSRFTVDDDGRPVPADEVLWPLEA